MKTGIQDDTYIEILSGLQTGEDIVAGPYSAGSRKLEGGMRVRAKENKENPAKPD